MGSEGQIEKHDLSTAPLMTRDAYNIAGYSEDATQYGVMGRAISTQ